MSAPRLPSVRLPAIVAGAAGGDDDPDAVVVELPPSTRFGIAWPAESPTHIPNPSELASNVTLSSSSEGETDLSDDEPANTARRPPHTATEESDGSEFVTPTNSLATDRDPMEHANPSPSIPRLSRAFSMPLPSQLGPFQNPRRAPSSTGSFSPSPMAGPYEEPVHLQELSLELADSVQMVIQTLLQLSPPQVLDPAKEQFAACSLSIPTPSISAMFTSMKNLNFMSANMSTFGSDGGPSPNSPAGSARSARAASGSSTYVDFDVGEMLQSVGDALSGVAAQAGVDLVLFHEDLGLRHVAVKGDESGLSYTLSHILRQVISVAKQGDSIEIGLFIDSAKNPQRSLSPGAPSRSGSPVLGTDGPLRCSFHIAHRFGMQEPPSSIPVGEGAGDAAVEDDGLPPLPSRNVPSFKTLILRRLLQHVDAHLEPDIANRGALVGRTCVLTTTLDRGIPSVVDPAVNLSPEEAAYLGYPAELRISHEPTLEQLTQFAESLRGRKVTLFAHSKGSFARHLTSYLTNWGLDVSHVSTEPDAESLVELGEKLAETESTTSRDSGGAEPSPPNVSPPTGSPTSAEPFVLIDDDVGVLRARLQKIRAEQVYPLQLHSRKRPSLAQNHRPRSSPQVARVMGMTPMPAQVTPQVVIVHFTSLENFKLVKDAIQSIMTPGNSWTRLPEVIVIPKPAGPRRILTSLHTAVTKPVVDPFFAPIATSPVSPSFHNMTPFFTTANNQRSPGGRSTGSMRTSSDRSARSPKETGLDSVNHAPSSPLGAPDTMEYFSDAATKLGTSPSSGLVIQSPDGQPAGIFFHPKSKGKDSAAGTRARAYSAAEGGRSRGTTSRRTSDGDETRRALTFIAPEIARRSPHAEKTPTEVVFEVGTPVMPSSTKGKARAPPLVESTSEEPDLAASSMSDKPPLSPVPPKLTRRISQDPRHSPPLSPQGRSPASGPAPRRQPAKRSSTEATSSASSVPTAKKGARVGENNIVPPISVLIVDDNPINQTILSTFMKKKKIKYDVAKNGEEAVQKWRSGGFHLILMDIQMPVMDGIQATKEIRRMEKSNGVGGFPSTPQSEGQQTPSDTSTSETRSATTPSYRSSVIIVALTASSLQSDRVAALAAGCNDFLTKPVSLHWLNSKIIEWGSIKALQMWADIRPEVVRSITSGQNAQAQSVASRLHVPEGRSSPATSRSSSQTRRASMDAAITLSKADSKLPAQSQAQSEGSSELMSEPPGQGQTPRPRECALGLRPSLYFPLTFIPLQHRRVLV
ncbi:uncharacterized protein BXZ73DRAFT_49083 [Epithele typhae]|uniref:uncharacterized protein n=1 Tax=Epithele typhae TaxID=378194 RepID=UPI00200845EA|nr:uncharacterized protein BXZ73DRAFT_49083 [Epithele typhae]KAH9927145.1 hypothetical protein BXZ73DRAFT_49083 [Epithele typhae]